MWVPHIFGAVSRSRILRLVCGAIRLLLDDQFRQVGHNLLDDHECGEAKDRKPPGVSYYDVILIWQSLILGNIEKELHESSEQRRADVVDELPCADAVAVLRPEELQSPLSDTCTSNR